MVVSEVGKGFSEILLDKVGFVGFSVGFGLFSGGEGDDYYAYNKGEKGEETDRNNREKSRNGEENAAEGGGNYSSYGGIAPAFLGFLVVGLAGFFYIGEGHGSIMA